MRQAGVAFAVLVVLLASGCGAGSRTGPTSASQLPSWIRVYIRRSTTPPFDPATFGKSREVDVYGPSPEHALLNAIGDHYPRGDHVPATKNYYLVVFHGHFVCKTCSGAVRGYHGTAYVDIFDARGGATYVGGIVPSLPATVVKLHRLTKILVY